MWRYSPIGDLDLGRFTSGVLGSVPIESALTEDSLLVVRVGALSDLPTLEGMTISTLGDHPEASVLLGSEAGLDDPLAALNEANLNDAIIIDIERGVRLEKPIVVVNALETGAIFPRLIVRLGDAAVASVVELFVGGDSETLNVPVTELTVGDAGVLTYGSLQVLDMGAWHLATVKATVGRDATISELTAGLGAAYDRLRTDVVLAGQGASSVLRSTYLGSGDQVHDLRTHQDHAAPRTMSDLLCKGAVDDQSRSVYTGVLQVRHGAIRSDAQQSNHNLVLAPEAHADSVPNLDIAENDVRCSHASTVGPLDEDQRYYLESRGVSPEDAERLLIRGFFRDLLDRSELRSAAELVRGEIEARLSGGAR